MTYLETFANLKQSSSAKELNSNLECKYIDISLWVNTGTAVILHCMHCIFC